MLNRKSARRFVLVSSVALAALSISPISSHAAGYPTRIISLSPSATEDLFAIGAGSQVIAVDQYSNYPTTAPISKLDSYSPNVEAIAAYKPDLVVLNADATKADAVKAALKKLNIAVYFEKAPSDIKGAYLEIQALGRLTGKAVEANDLVSTMQVKIQKAIHTGRKLKNVTFFHELDNTLYTATSNTFIGHVYSDFGYSNIADAADAADSGGYPQLTSEYVLKANPKVIFLSDNEPVANVKARAGWSNIDAVKKNKIITLPDDIPSRWGPRLVDFYQFIAANLSK